MIANDFFTDSTLAQFTNEPGQYGPLVSTAAQGEAFAYHFDGPGSTQQMTDGGQVVRADIVYKAFGEMLSNTGDAPNLFYYIGQWGYQTELPFWSYVRRRYLASDFGRWLSRDPDPLRQMRSGLYVYVLNSPPNLIDLHFLTSVHVMRLGR